MFLHNLIILFLCVSSIPIQGAWKSRALPPERAPYADVEAKITNAAAVRDNGRISGNRTTPQLSFVISATAQCADAAAHGMRYTIIAQNLTAYQLALFSFHGFTLVKLSENTEENVPQYNITWRLIV